MKRIISLMLCLVLAIMCMPISAGASGTTPNGKSQDVIQFADGSWIEITIEAFETKTANTKRGSKTYTYRNSNGTVDWSATLNGTFSYTGVSSVCTDAVSA